MMYCEGTNPWTLVVARGLQGASAAVIQIVGLALIADTASESSVGSTMGWQSIAMFAGSISGPPLGGLVFDFAGHLAVFGLAYALLIPDLVFRLLIRDGKRDSPSTHRAQQKDYGTMDGANVDNEAAVTSERDLHSDANEDASSGDAEQGIPDKKQKQQTSIPVILSLLSIPRLLAALWAVFVSAVMLTGIETVRSPLSSLLNICTYLT